MVTSNTSTTSEHPKDLLLPYLEGSLSPADKARVLSHIQTCADCSTELKDLEEIGSVLKLNKEEAFCPEPWELCEFVQTGKDPTGRFSKHLARCDFCREEADACRILPERDVMPQELWERGKDLLARPVLSQKPREARHRLTGLSDWISSLLNVPVLAMAAAAAVLVIVVLYQGKPLVPSPQTTPGPAVSAKAKRVIALSSVKWDRDDGIELMSPVPAVPQPVTEPGQIKKRRIAMLIFFENLPYPFKQERIDRLYEAIRPTAAVNERFSVLTPDELKEAINKGQIKTGEKDEILKGLQDKLKVSDAIFITIAAKSDRFDVESELLDAKSGDRVKEKTKTGVRDSQLPLKVREASALIE